MDGLWYDWTVPPHQVGLDRVLERGSQLSGARRVELSDKWARPKEGNDPLPFATGKKLELTPGKHVVRVRWPLARQMDRNVPADAMGMKENGLGPRVDAIENFKRSQKWAISNPVEFAIQPADAQPAAN